MTTQETERALKEGVMVAVVLFGKSHPYVGKIKKALGNGYFLFEGKSESENLSGKVTAEQVSLWQD